MRTGGVNCLNSQHKIFSEHLSYKCSQLCSLNKITWIQQHKDFLRLPNYANYSSTQSWTLRSPPDVVIYSAHLRHSVKHGVEHVCCRIKFWKTNNASLAFLVSCSAPSLLLNSLRNDKKGFSHHFYDGWAQLSTNCSSWKWADWIFGTHDRFKELSSIKIILFSLTLLYLVSIQPCK